MMPVAKERFERVVAGSDLARAPQFWISEAKKNSKSGVTSAPRRASTCCCCLDPTHPH